MEIWDAYNINDSLLTKDIIKEKETPKKTIISIVIAIILISISINSYASNGNDIIYFIDLEFKSYLLDEGIDINNDGEISKDEAQKVTRLSISNMAKRYHYSNKKEVRITGIEYFTELEYLTLKKNMIIDISPLRNLSKLKELNLEGNSIEDISALSNLINLEMLNVNGNNISDVSALSYCNKLKKLVLGYLISGNPIENIEPICNINSITNLYLSNLRLENIENITNLNNLEVLYLDNNSIEDIAPLKSLNKLKTLSLNDSNQIEDFSVFLEMQSLNSLSLDNTKIKEFSVLRNLSQLTILRLNSNNIEDIQLIPSLPNLLELELKDNDISIITPIKGFDNLVKLNLEYNSLEKMDFGDNLKNLECLNLSYAELEKIEGIEGLSNLTVLIVNYNNLEKEDFETLLDLNNTFQICLTSNYIDFENKDNKDDTIYKILEKGFTIHLDISQKTITKVNNDDYGYDNEDNSKIDNSVYFIPEEENNINDYIEIDDLKNKIEKILMINVINKIEIFIENNPNIFYCIIGSSVWAICLIVIFVKEKRNSKVE